MRRLLNVAAPTALIVLALVAALSAAWTSPRTWVTNELVTAALMNTHIRDNLLAIFPNGDGSTTYTPTWSGGSPSIGNGTLTGRYQRTGKRIDLQIQLTGGSTTNWGGATGWAFSLPVTAVSDTVYYVGIAHILDSGTGFHTGVALINPGGTTFSINPSTAGTGGVFNSTNPITWATGDEIRINITYTVA